MGEYGEHWNFFFTLAAVSALTAVVRLPPAALLPVGAVVLAAHQASGIWPSQDINVSSSPAITSPLTAGYHLIIGRLVWYPGA